VPAKYRVDVVAGRLAPDHKTIAELRRMHREGVTAAGAESVRLARSVGLVKGEWIVIDGSKFQAVRSAQVNGSPANRLKPFPSTVTRLP
jgi:hypothetical protein